MNRRVGYVVGFWQFRLVGYVVVFWQLASWALAFELLDYWFSNFWTRVFGIYWIIGFWQFYSWVLAPFAE